MTSSSLQVWWCPHGQLQPPEGFQSHHLSVSQAFKITPTCFVQCVLNHTEVVSSFPKMIFEHCSPKIIFGEFFFQFRSWFFKQFQFSLHVWSKTQAESWSKSDKSSRNFENCRQGPTHYGKFAGRTHAHKILFIYYLFFLACRIGSLHSKTTWIFPVVCAVTSGWVSRLAACEVRGKAQQNPWKGRKAMEKMHLQQEHLLMRNYSKPCNSTWYLSAYFYTTSYFTGLWFLAKCIESGSLAAVLSMWLGL